MAGTRVTSALATLLTSCFVSIASGETLNDVFRAGVEAFDAGRYNEAARVFSDLRTRYRVTSPSLLVNLGASEFMAGRPGYALLHFHEAMKAAPGSPAAETARLNAARVRAVLNERRGAGGTGYVYGPYHDAWTALFGWLPARETLISFLVVWWILFLSLVGRRVVTGRVQRLLTGIVIAGVIGSVLTGISAYGALRVSSYEVGVVLADAALYDRADAIEPSSFLPEALEVRVLERQGAHVRVRLSSGEKGWVPERALGVPDLTGP